MNLWPDTEFGRWANDEMRRIKKQMEGLLADIDKNSKPELLAKVLGERGKTHGDWEEQSRLEQKLKEVIRASDNWQDLTSQQKSSLEAVAMKISRILTGEPNNPEHWLDCEGYFRITRERLPK